MRTIKKTVTFRHPFVLGELEEVLPPGDYTVETDEELIQGLSFPAYKRVLTVIRLPVTRGNFALTRAMTIAPETLARAVEQDRSYGTGEDNRSSSAGSP
jgi:hypothetical protein